MIYTHYIEQKDKILHYITDFPSYISKINEVFSKSISVTDFLFQLLGEHRILPEHGNVIYLRFATSINNISNDIIIESIQYFKDLLANGRKKILIIDLDTPNLEDRYVEPILNDLNEKKARMVFLKSLLQNTFFDTIYLIPENSTALGVYPSNYLLEFQSFLKLNNVHLDIFIDNEETVSMLNGLKNTDLYIDVLRLPGSIDFSGGYSSFKNFDYYNDIKFNRINTIILQDEIGKYQTGSTMGINKFYCLLNSSFFENVKHFKSYNKINIDYDRVPFWGYFFNKNRVTKLETLVAPSIDIKCCKLLNKYLTSPILYVGFHTNIGHGYLYDDDFKKLAKLENLNQMKKIYFYESDVDLNYFQSCNHIIYDDSHYFNMKKLCQAKLQNIEILEISNCNITDSDVEYLVRYHTCKNLKLINLSHNLITDTGKEFLQQDNFFNDIEINLNNNLLSLPL